MGGKYIVLVIDDEASVRLILSKILERAGFEIKCAGNPMEGLKIARKEDVDIILLDVNMPLMDGFEVLEKLKSNKRTKKIPVVMLTCQGELDDFDKGHDLGVHDYITKPFEARILVGRVNRAIVYSTRADEFPEAAGN